MLPVVATLSLPDAFWFEMQLIRKHTNHGRNPKMSGTEIIAVLVMFCLAVWLIGARFTITNLVRISGATLMIFGGDSIAFRGLNNQNEYSLTWTVLGILIFLFGICIVAASLFASETFTKKDAAEEKSSESTKPP